jgi:transcriptional regulator with XRE-family HTH domain
MAGTGLMLRGFRQKLGLTLREVEDRSTRVATKWGMPSYRISASWLDRVEREEGELTFTKFIVLTVIYGISSDQLLDICNPLRATSEDLVDLLGPDSTLLLAKGPLDDLARQWLPEDMVAHAIPEDTTLLPPPVHLRSHYRRAMIGRRDTALVPMIRPGSIVLINTQRRTIAHRREWTDEFDRPIYLLLTHAGYVCGWCELDRSGKWLTLVPHPMSYAPGQRWRYRKEVDVIGRVAVILLRLEEPDCGESHRL